MIFPFQTTVKMESQGGAKNLDVALTEVHYPNSFLLFILTRIENREFFRVARQADVNEKECAWTVGWNGRRASPDRL